VCVCVCVCDLPRTRALNVPSLEPYTEKRENFSLWFAGIFSGLVFPFIGLNGMFDSGKKKLC